MFKTSKSTDESTQPVTHSMRPSMNIWNSFTLGFAVVSPIVGLYAIIGVQTTVTGGGWFAALVICLLMQLLVATVYAELSSQFPIAGGAYKWARQLYGITAGHYAGVIYVSSTIAMLTTTAYAGGIWFAGFFGSEGESGSEKVVYPGGTGTGRQSGNAAIASKTPKPRSCKVFLISPTVRVSLRYTTTTFSSNSEVDRPLTLLLLGL